ncbi:MAG: cyclase family protein [Thermodesulfobacteriota bacterium]
MGMIRAERFMLANHLKELLKKSKVFDLGQPYFTGMPHHPNQPPFAYTLLKKHGDITLEKERVSFCNDLFTMGGHTGTHLDAKAHVARNNRITNDIDISGLQDYQNGLKVMGIETTPPVVRKGVLLDIPPLLNLEVLPHDFGIGEKEMEETAEKEGVKIEEGDVVLIRTGWMKFWDDRRKYLSIEEGVPGVIEGGAKFLAQKGISFTGSDTTAYDKVPPHHLPCHVILLVENGIQIMEMLNLDELSKNRTYAFLFIALPLKIRGGAGSPIRPIAIA